ncbi:MAG: Glucose-1-phosphate thymidylyltransferase [Verrucomicrobia subdivision 3 bacterium]|nr:Glucose-1-phosphate thymidylyltransferase [Limisphaerales bacterium]MCS1414552.1 Glucose-1-phosphate thymidylyltransferase [Limisphaerales bacterium]
MKLVILAAGYSSRLHPLTLTQPKPLLEVAGRPIIDRVLENLVMIDSIDQIYIVSNQKFAPQFAQWANGKDEALRQRITVVNDGSTSAETRLGAIGDLGLVMREHALDDDLIVVAGDNLFSQSLELFGDYCREVNAAVLGVYDVGRLEAAKNYSAVHTDMEGQVTSFEEKPESPETTLIGIALYYYPKSVLPKINAFLDGDNDPDKPGRLVQWLYPRLPVFTWSVPGIWYDIGSKETLEEANRIFKGR